MYVIRLFVLGPLQIRIPDYAHVQIFAMTGLQLLCTDVYALPVRCQDYYGPGVLVARSVLRQR